MGLESAKQLAQARVLIVGSGGLGSPVSLFLAGAGVGEITLIDPDTVSLSNLHRQILFQETDVNQSKVERAKARLTALNGDIKINVINAKLGPNTVASLVANATVVVDAADNFLTSYLLSDACFTHRTPLVSASVISTHGYVGVFCGTQAQPAPSLRGVFPSPAGPAQSCSTAGVTGPSVGILGSYQAQEALKVIMQDPHQLLGKLLYVDAWNYQHTIVDFTAAKEPATHAAIIDCDAIGHTDVVIDVRTAAEFSRTVINPSAINTPLITLETEPLNVDSSKRVVCLCASGQRALIAAELLLKKGHSNVAVAAH